MNPEKKYWILLIVLTAIVSEIGCTDGKRQGTVISASISDIPIRLVYDKEDPIAPSLLIPVEINIDNSSSKAKVFSSVFFSKGSIDGYCVYEMVGDKLIKRSQTRKDTILIKPNARKKYIAYSNIEVYTPNYLEFQWKHQEQKLVASGNDTLQLENYRTFSKRYEKLGKALNIDSLQLWFYDSDYKESLYQLKIVVQ